MDLTAEQIAELAAKAANDVVEKLQKIDRKFIPGGNVEVTSNPEDRLLADPKGGFKSFGHLAMDVIRADTNSGVSDELRKWRGVCKTSMEEGDLAQGGALVPEEFSTAILTKSLENAIVRPRATIQPMASNRITFAADVDYDHSASYFGGIIIYRPGEGETKTISKPTYERIALTLHKLTGMVYVTDELLEDSMVALEAEIMRKFSTAIAFVEDDDFLNGTGANMALGAFNAANPSLIAVAKEAGQPAATILAENIAKMWARLYPAGHGKAVWVANINTFTQLFGMSLAVGTGGIPVWMPAGGISGRPYETLMGAPLLYSEKMQTLGAQGDIGLADFSQYKIGQKQGGGLKVATSIHFRFNYDEQAFRFVLRYDGQPTWSSTLIPHKGGAGSTLSPFVVLAVRA